MQYVCLSLDAIDDATRKQLSFVPSWRKNDMLQMVVADM